MRVLLVEDDERVLPTLEQELTRVSPGIGFHLARSRESAFAILQSLDDIDLVLCDIRIPSHDGALDTADVHGRAVFDRTREVLPGTPIRFLTAHGTPEIISEPLSNAPTLDVFGTGQSYPLSGWFDKSSYEKCIACIAEVAIELARLDQIEIAGLTPAFQMPPQHKRALRIFARRMEGTIVKVSPLSGGLTDALTMRAHVYDKDEGFRAFVFAKLAPLDTVHDEDHRYQQFIAPALAPGTFAQYIDKVVAGCSRIGGIFYRLAERHDRDLFQFITDRPKKAAEVARRLQKLQEPWQKGKRPRTVPIRDIRRVLITDEELAKVRNIPKDLDIDTIEDRVIQVRQVCQHGDLHGLNILVASSGEPLLVDFGDVSLSFASLDPIILELSFLFHPAGRPVVGGWPTPDQASSWADLDDYVQLCPISDFVRACRAWAFKDSLGEQAVFANAYAYALRQLKYPNTDHDLAIAIARSAARRLISA